MKIAVYAISKNVVESVDRFIDGLDALGLTAYVLDHSADGTAEKLRQRGATVDTTPMKRDFAMMKNYALNMVPCKESYPWVINMDLDEVADVGAMKRLIAQMDYKATRIRHFYKPDGDIDRVREEYRIHRRVGYKWVWPIHECLEYDGKENIQFIPECILTQWPDKNRKHTWCDMLEQAVRDYPDSTRMRMLCGRDLYFDGRYAEALAQFMAFMGLEAKSFDLSYVLTMAARCHKKLGDAAKELAFLKKAAMVCKRRESWVELAHAYLLRGNDEAAQDCALSALDMTEGQYAAHSDPGAWSWKPYEIAMLAAYNLDDLDAAVEAGEKAMALSTGEDQKRIQTNLLTFKAKMDEMAELNA